MSLRDQHKSGGKSSGAKVVKKPNILAQAIKKPTAASANSTVTATSNNSTPASATSETQGAVLPPVSTHSWNACSFVEHGRAVLLAAGYPILSQLSDN